MTAFGIHIPYSSIKFNAPRFKHCCMIHALWTRVSRDMILRNAFYMIVD